MDSVDADPEQEVVVDLEARIVRYRGGELPAQIPDGVRDQLASGGWNATAVLLEAGDAIEERAGQLPYVQGF
jgi:3-isopropylmalate/(R)-2-methylmalate dehydratase small subunit